MGCKRDALQVFLKKEGDRILIEQVMGWIRCKYFPFPGFGNHIKRTQIEKSIGIRPVKRGKTTLRLLFIIASCAASLCIDLKPIQQRADAALRTVIPHAVANTSRTPLSMQARKAGSPVESICS